MLNAVECLRSLLIHLLREAEVRYADDIVTANLRCVRLQLLVCEVHLTQGLEDAVEINLAFTHSGVLMDGVVSTAVLVQPGRIYDIAAVLGLVPGVSQKNVGQFIAGVLQHVANVALALIVEEAVGCGVNVAQVLGTEGLNDVAGLIVQLYEVIRMGLALYADALTLDDREKLLHRLEEHAVADLLLVRVAGELGVDDRYAHVNRDFDHTLPVCNCVLALLLGRTGPAVNNDERGNLYTGLLESLLVLLLALLFGCEKDTGTSGSSPVCFYLSPEPSTRATDTEFEKGDAIGVFAAARDDESVPAQLHPSGNFADNKKYIFDGEKFVPDGESNSIFITSYPIDYYAYYPYATVDNPLEFTFHVLLTRKV